MRKPVLLIWTNAAILIVLFAALTQSLFLVTRIAHTRWARGQVEVSRSGQSDWTPVASGTPIKAGDTLQTGSDGRAEFAWADGTRWKLEPNTRLVVQRAFGSSWRGGEHTQFRLESGKVWVRVVKRLDKNSSFGIETPSALATVRGTVWSIEVAGTNTLVGVWKGFVDISAAGAKTRVSSDSKAVVSDAGVELQNASSDDKTAFELQTDLTRPELEVDVKVGRSSAILSGHTEAGNTLMLGCESLNVLSNGAFITRLPLVKGHNEWKLTATDLHGETTSACHAAEFDGQKATTSACHP